MIWFLLIDLIGLLLGFLLFVRRPVLAESKDIDDVFLSVIVPARNEAKNLPHLLQSLLKQTRLPDEIICVDDDSTDDTATIAARFGVQVIKSNVMPEGWIGKSWACQQGADQAEGDVLLFIDADVCLARGAIHKLLATRADGEGVVSVLPHHRIRRLYEFFSIFFSLIQVAANGVSMAFGSGRAGLFGPIIMISRKDYQTIGGHRAARQSIVDDIALGRALARHKIPVRLFFGGADISYRMYGEGVLHLFRGWLKNIAAGAAQTPTLHLIMAVWWLTGCLGITVDIIRISIQAEYLLLIPAVLIQLAFIAQVIWATRKVGNFNPLFVVIYPIWLLGFMFVFVLSVFVKIFGLQVVWKDRKVDPCN